MLYIYSSFTWTQKKYETGFYCSTRNWPVRRTRTKHLIFGHKRHKWIDREDWLVEKKNQSHKIHCSEWGSHLTFRRWFVCLCDPGSYISWSSALLVGSSCQTARRVTIRWRVFLWSSSLGLWRRVTTLPLERCSTNWRCRSWDCNGTLFDSKGDEKTRVRVVPRTVAPKYRNYVLPGRKDQGKKWIGSRCSQGAGRT